TRSKRDWSSDVCSSDLWFVVLRSGWWGGDDGSWSQDHHSLCHADGTEVAVPALDGVVLGEAVATEELDAVEADLHALLGGALAGERGLPGEGHALLGACGAPPGGQARPAEPGRVGGDHARAGLTVGERLTGRLALPRAGRHGVEHGVWGAERQRGPAGAGQPDDGRGGGGALVGRGVRSAEDDV